MTVRPRRRWCMASLIAADREAASVAVYRPVPRPPEETAGLTTKSPWAGKRV